MSRYVTSVRVLCKRCLPVGMNIHSHYAKCHTHRPLIGYVSQTQLYFVQKVAFVPAIVNHTPAILSISPSPAKFIKLA